MEGKQNTYLKFPKKKSKTMEHTNIYKQKF